MSNTSNNAGQVMSQARLACLVALLAAPLAACSDRSAQPENTQGDSGQAQAVPAEGAQQPAVEPTDTTYTDGYSKPREAWTGGATAEDAQFKGSADSDAQAVAQLKRELSADRGRCAGRHRPPHGRGGIGGRSPGRRRGRHGRGGRRRRQERAAGELEGGLRYSAPGRPAPATAAPRLMAK